MAAKPYMVVINGEMVYRDYENPIVDQDNAPNAPEPIFPRSTVNPLELMETLHTKPLRT